MSNNYIILYSICLNERRGYNYYQVQKDAATI